VKLNWSLKSHILRSSQDSARRLTVLGVSLSLWWTCNSDCQIPAVSVLHVYVQTCGDAGKSTRSELMILLQC